MGTTKKRKALLTACLPWLLLWGCNDSATDTTEEDPAGESPRPTDMYDDPVTGSNGGEPKPDPDPEVDAAVTDAGMDAGSVLPELDSSVPDPDPYDAGRTVYCTETFVFDPGERTDVTGVVLAGGYPLSWGATVASGGREMTLGEDGLYRVELELPRAAIPYKFVVNGMQWLPDPSACADQDDGFNGRNSVRYACGAEPGCPALPDAGSDGGVIIPDTDAAVVTPDAGLSVDGGVAAPDASVSVDAAVDAGSVVVIDAGLASDAGADTDAGEPSDSIALDPCGCDPLLVWLDLSTVQDGNPTPVTGVQIRGEVEALGKWGAPGAPLNEVEDGVWAGYVARGLPDVEYKLVILHEDGGETWLLDPNSCEATRNTNSVLDGCFDGPATCEAQLDAPLATPPVVSDACKDDCEVEVAVPASLVSGATFVDLVGEYPLTWYAADGLPLVLGDDDVWRLRLRMPAGASEYKLTTNGMDLISDPANCAVQSGPYGNSLLYACEAAPACE